MNNDDIGKIEEQVKELLDEGSDVESEETKKVEDIQELSSDEEESIEEMEEVIPEEPVVEIEEKKKEVITDTTAPLEEMPKKKKNKKIILIIALCVVVLIVLGVLWFFLFPKKETSTTSTSKSKLAQETQQQIIEEYGEALHSIINAYIDNQDMLLDYETAVILVKYNHNVVCNEHKIYNDGNIYLNQCSIDGEEVSYSFGEKRESTIYQGGAVKVYVSSKTQEATLGKPSNVRLYDLYTFDIDEDYFELNLLDSRSPYIIYRQTKTYKNRIINFKTRNDALGNLNEYSSVSPITNGDSFDSQNVIVCISYYNCGIYNLDNQEFSINPAGYQLLGFGGKYYHNSGVFALDGTILGALRYSGDNSTYGLLNYKTNQMIVDFIYTKMNESGDYLFVVGFDGQGHLIDYYGVEKFDSSKYEKVFDALDGKYILVQENDEIKLVDITGELLYNFGNIDMDKTKYNYGIFYQDVSTFYFGNMRYSQEEVDGVCYNLKYDASTKEGEVKEKNCNLSS